MEKYEYKNKFILKSEKTLVEDCQLFWLHER